MPVISLYADGSFCPKTKAAGGAYVAKCGDLMIRDRFEIEALKDSWESEIITYGKALQAMMKHPKFKKYLRKGTVIVAVLDCEGVGTFVKSDKSHSVKGRKFPTHTLSVRELHNMLRTYTEVKVTFEHVKAHTNADTIAAFYNSHVDREARACMENMRKKLKK